VIIHQNFYILRDHVAKAPVNLGFMRSMTRGSIWEELPLSLEASLEEVIETLTLAFVIIVDVGIADHKDLGLVLRSQLDG
jgi:hypothetical protein